MRTFVLAVAALLVGAFLSHAWAQPQTQSREERERAMVRAAGELKPQSGTITVADGKAQVNASRLKYLSPADTEKLLSEIWGNPRGTGRGNLGALVPAGFDPLTEESWAIVLFYSNDGHVADEEAEKIDYAELLRDMQQAIREDNEERLRQGGHALELVGWARPPFYDRAQHKLHWAKQLRSVGGDSLNYNVRVLGREGVLELNFVASMDSLAEIEKAIPAVLADVNFTDGNRYDQYNASTDKLAEYGIAALIAGGVLKKVGFFGVIIAAILAAKKFVIIGVIALVAVFGGFFKRLFRGSRLPPPTQPPAA